jgi:uncharacterized membrane protein
MDTYLLFKSLHLIGVILFIGNVAVSGMWKAMADRTRDPRIIAFAQRLITMTDWTFTLTGVVLVGISGFASAGTAHLPMSTPWIAIGTGLFAGSGAIWLAILVPLQLKLGRLAKSFTDGGTIPDAYWRLEKLWVVFGILATILPIVAVPVMVFKAG